MKVSGILTAVVLIVLFLIAVPCYVFKPLCERGGTYQVFFSNVSNALGDNFTTVVIVIIFVVAAFEFTMKNTK